MLLNNINKYRYISGKDNTLFCVKDNIIIEFTPVSQIQYFGSFNILNQEEELINNSTSKINSLASLFDDSDNSLEIQEEVNHSIYEYNQNNFYSNYIMNKFQKERNEASKEAINKILQNIMKTPILITYHINIFFFNNDNKELTLDNLLKMDSKDYSPLYYQFISQLGDLYIDENGNRTLSFKDHLYNIIFEFVDLKKKKEEKIQLIKENTFNIIWIDNPVTKLSNIESLFSSINQNHYVVILVSPRTKIHCLVEFIEKKTEIQPLDIQKNFKNSYLKDFSIFSLLFCESFYINTIAYSGIRYLINCITILSDWFFFIQNSKTPQIKPNANYYYEPRIKTNCLYDRLILISKLNNSVFN